MQVSDISEADLTALKGQGYTEGDLEMLAESEVKSLLTPERSEVDDPHEAAARSQDDEQASAPAPAAPAAAPAPAPAQAADPVRYDVKVPDDADDKIKTLRGEDKAAFQRLMDGEIDAEEYQAVKDRVDGEIDKVREQVLTAKVLQTANAQSEEQAAQREWKTAEARAMADFKGEGLDYMSKPALLAAYNTHLKALATDPKNSERDADWFLRGAHAAMKADLGITTRQKSGDPAAARVDNVEIPPTLRGVPPAAVSEIGSNEFVHLDNLNGVDLERAVAAMSDAQRDRWLNQ